MRTGIVRSSPAGTELAAPGAESELTTQERIEAVVTGCADDGPATLLIEELEAGVRQDVFKSLTGTYLWGDRHRACRGTFAVPPKPGDRGLDRLPEDR